MARYLPTLMKSKPFSSDRKRTSPKGPEAEEKVGARSSQAAYAEKTQTMAIFDWDDTLFPTTYLLTTLAADWRLPLCQQRWKTSDIDRAVSEMSRLETHALELLQRACSRSHVTVLTLAKVDWVEQSCHLYYSKVGAFIQRHNIPVIYAREAMTPAEQGRIKQDDRDDLYAILKGHAMRTEVQKFYSQYPGQTWKNVLCFGDSMFEHHGLLAASRAYMKGETAGASSALTKIGPRTAPQLCAWEKPAAHNESFIRLRIKCCKLVDQPAPCELELQLKTVRSWFNHMVDLDDGFDLDLEAVCNATKLAVAESVLRGQRPVSLLHKSGLTFKSD